MGSGLHYFSYCYPLPVIDTFSGIMQAQQIRLGANPSSAIIHSSIFKHFIFVLNLLAAGKKNCLQDINNNKDGLPPTKKSRTFVMNIRDYLF